MIKPGEIQQKARMFGVRDQQIEKDYILSWILYGIAKHENLSKTIVFKGGTLLKKVYFEDYRFSEDLDFTLLHSSSNSEMQINEHILSWFIDSFAFIQEEANIPLSILDNATYEDRDIHFYIGYVGPLGGKGYNKKVKVDISCGEQLVFEQRIKHVIIDYSDLPEYKVLCYSLEEVLIEKMRTVMQRMQARDFYDIWYLLTQNEMNIEFYIKEFEAKCKSKFLIHSDFPHVLNKRLPQYKARWKSSLSQQIKDLPDFEQVEREVLRQLKEVKL
jgi:predicted nucleotidyltransferase component of viral defense system